MVVLDWAMVLNETHKVALAKFHAHDKISLFYLFLFYKRNPTVVLEEFINMKHVWIPLQLLKDSILLLRLSIRISV